MKHKLEIFSILALAILSISLLLLNKNTPEAGFQKKILITKESDIIDYQTGQDAIMLEYFVDGIPAHYIVAKSEFSNIPKFMDYLESLGSVVNLLPESKK